MIDAGSFDADFCRDVTKIQAAVAVCTGDPGRGSEDLLS
jgi:hypothetical protein